jgi:hypothetical protein
MLIGGHHTIHNTDMHMQKLKGSGCQVCWTTLKDGNMKQECTQAHRKKGSNRSTLRRGFLAALLQVKLGSSSVMSVLGSQRSMLRRLGDSDNSDSDSEAPLVCHVAIVVTAFEQRAHQ